MFRFLNSDNVLQIGWLCKREDGNKKVAHDIAPSQGCLVGASCKMDWIDSAEATSDYEGLRMDWQWLTGRGVKY